MIVRDTLLAARILLVFCALAGAREATPASQPAASGPATGSAEDSPSPKDRRQQAHERVVRRREWRTRYRQLIRRYARAESASDREDIIGELYQVRDVDGLAEMTHLFDCDYVELRQAALTIASQRDFVSEHLSRDLIDVILNDPVDGIRTVAVGALERVRTSGDIKTLLRALKRGERREAGWAAIALGRLRDYEAVEPLIKQLRVAVTVPASTMDAHGSVTYIAGWEVKIAPGTVAYQPIIKKRGGGRRIAKGRRREWAGNRDVLDALVEITGQDFGFDQNVWTAWWKESGKELLAQERLRRKAQEPPPEK